MIKLDKRNQSMVVIKIRNQSMVGLIRNQSMVVIKTVHGRDKVVINEISPFFHHFQLKFFALFLLQLFQPRVKSLQCYNAVTMCPFPSSVSVFSFLAFTDEKTDHFYGPLNGCKNGAL